MPCGTPWPTARASACRTPAEAHSGSRCPPLPGRVWASSGNRRGLFLHQSMNSDVDVQGRESGHSGTVSAMDGADRAPREGFTAFPEWRLSLPFPSGLPSLCISEVHCSPKRPPQSGFMERLWPGMVVRGSPGWICVARVRPGGAPTGSGRYTVGSSGICAPTRGHPVEGIGSAGVGNEWQYLRSRS